MLNTTSLKDNLDGPYVVSDILKEFARTGAAGLPYRLQLLILQKRFFPMKTALRVIIASGMDMIMSGNDVLSFQGDRPYALLHLQ